MKKIGRKTIAIIVLLIGFSVFCINEFYNHRKAEIANFVENNVIEVDANNIDRENNLKLISASAPIITHDILNDGFTHAVKTIVLERKVKMFQWDERVKDDKRVYEKKWSQDPINTKNFEDKTYVNPPFPVESKTTYSTSAMFGQYHIAEEQLKQVNAEDDYMGLFPKAGYTILKNQYFNGKDIKNPQVGDVLITYRYTKSGEPFSIIGQQNGDTIVPMPYKLTPIYIQYKGDLSTEQMIKRFKSDNFVTTNIVRLVGLLILIFGIVLLLNPKNIFKVQ
ncbi:hypothetical protein IJ674_09800 [bacterium]|nr:hypothetical protein [bacterium]